MKMFLRGRIVPACVALSGCALAFPDREAHAQNSPVWLPTIVISATGIATAAREIASSVTVVTAEDIEREQRRTVTDVLQLVPGLNVVQNGTPGTQTAVFIRGTNSNHVKVLIDGVDASDPSTPNGAVDFGQLTTADIERVEVLRGPQSGLYGANAIGGVISITTKKGEGPTKLTGWAEGGAFGTFNQAGSVSGGTDRFHYSFNATHFKYTDMPVTPEYMVPPGGTRKGNAYDNWTYSTRFGANLTENVAVNFYGRYIDGKLNFSSDSFDFTTFLLQANPYQSVAQNLAFIGRAETVVTMFDGRFVNVFGANYTDYKRTNLDPGQTLNRFDGSREKYDWRGTLNFAPGQNLVMGLETETDRATTENMIAKTGNNAGYVELQSSFADRFFVVANIRRDSHDDFGGATTWRVAPAFIVPVTETKLKASYGTGFRAPTLYELYGFADFGFGFGYVGNPDLSPERSRGYDYGFEQPLFDGRVAFGATYFNNKINNLITFANSATPNVTTYENVARAVTRGYEAFASIVVTPQLRVRGDYTFTRAVDAETSEPLLRRPSDKWSISAIWSPIEQFTLTTTVLHVGGWWDFDRPGASFDPVYAPAYTIVNLAANYVLNDRAAIFGRIDNFFDRQYQNPLGWEQPGLGAYAGLRVKTN
jgi:vitamin B12 transporter